MRILYITYHYYPSTLANAKRPYCNVREFVQAGDSVDVVCCGVQKEKITDIHNNKKQLNVVKLKDPLLTLNIYLERTRLGCILSTAISGMMWPDVKILWTMIVAIRINTANYDRVIASILPMSMIAFSYIDHGEIFPMKLNPHTDPRGSFTEIIKLGTGGQVSFSTTVPGITRGNHFHVRKIERFAVIKGRAQIQLRRIGSKEVLNFELDGKEPAYVDMPVWFTHNITNIGEDELYTIFRINEFFDPKDPDTFFEPVED